MIFFLNNSNDLRLNILLWAPTNNFK